MKQFCMKINLISQGRENVLFLPSSMAAMMSHENALHVMIRELRENPDFLESLCRQRRSWSTGAISLDSTMIRTYIS